MSSVNTLDLALDYLKRHPNRYLAPLKRGSKSQPLIKDNLAQASNDPKQIREWYAKFPQCNWLLSLKKSGLIAVDVDNKPGKAGQTTWDMLDLEYGWPETERARSPSGGYHDIYEGDHVMAVNGFGMNVDSPNFVVMPGCPRADGGRYTLERDIPAAKAPEWFYGSQLLGKAKQKQIDVGDKIVSEDRDYNVEWAIDFLKTDADPAIEGQGGDFQTLKTAMSLRDKSIAFETAVDLMFQYYNERCIPAWDYDDLRKKVENAYSYASQSRMGETAVEATFADDDDGVDLDKIPSEMPEEEARVNNQEIADKKEREKQREVDLQDLFGDEDTQPDQIEQVLAGWVYVGDLARFVKLANPMMQWRKESFDNYYRYLLKNGKGSVSEKLLGYKVGGMRRFETVAYKPNKPRLVIDSRGNQALNLYVPSPVVPKEGDVSWWISHVEYLFPDPEDQKHLMNWLAWFYQNIEEKPLHALLIQGAQTGTGKSFVANLMAEIIGKDNRSAVEESLLATDFNGYAMRAKLITIEELRSVERNLVKSALHSMISQVDITINQKGLPTFPIENCFGVIASTNDDAAISLDVTDRRYLVLRTEAQKREQPYYDRLYGKLKDPAALAAFAYYLQNYDVGEYTGSGPAPYTSAKDDMIAAGLSELESWMNENRDQYPLNARVVQIKDVIDALPTRLSRTNRLSHAVSSALKTHFQAKIAGQFRVKGGRARLLVINGCGLMSIKDWQSSIAGIYESDKLKAASGPAPDAANDDDEPPMPLDDIGLDEL